jgi:hypothetical protein
MEYQCAWYRVLEASCGKEKRAKAASTHTCCRGAAHVIIEFKVVDGKVSDEVDNVSTELATNWRPIGKIY